MHSLCPLGRERYLYACLPQSRILPSCVLTLWMCVCVVCVCVYVLCVCVCMCVCVCVCLQLNINSKDRLLWERLAQFLTGSRRRRQVYKYHDPTSLSFFLLLTFLNPRRCAAGLQWSFCVSVCLSVSLSVGQLPRYNATIIDNDDDDNNNNILGL